MHIFSIFTPRQLPLSHTWLYNFFCVGNCIFCPCHKIHTARWGWCWNIVKEFEWIIGAFWSSDLMYKRILITKRIVILTQFCNTIYSPAWKRGREKWLTYGKYFPFVASHRILINTHAFIFIYILKEIRRHTHILSHIHTYSIMTHWDYEPFV